ncbi:hypothetical protein CONPUDRAFT_155503 [Coniophora puteana RWD-64-598 SS2]|uniref:Secreted protein n=1 Tax=Coniophora puteana (strain RWD-64-598) TaxID=741705 RepID=A0A5M3MJ09_CONPW|nr:uncharacterized protein CONPUDRAFT_155503 [Coniophora puteana RWD-64-598 SS2]EIW78774.1 hypothetical protein CONPUDRAFT_155503 [Coniophora puteana RWD-64-598 SS2]
MMRSRSRYLCFSKLCWVSFFIAGITALCRSEVVHHSGVGLVDGSGCSGEAEKRTEDGSGCSGEAEKQIEDSSGCSGEVEKQRSGTT